MPQSEKSPDPKFCQKRVIGIGGWHLIQCARKVKRDGWCWQHHPKEVEKRRAEGKARYDRELEIRQLPRKRLDEANKRIRELESQVKQLLIDRHRSGSN